MVEATKELLELTTPRTLLGDDIDSIIQKAKVGVQERKSIRQALKKKQQPQSPTVWIKKSEIEMLLHSQPEEMPIIAYTIGGILLWELSVPEEGSDATTERSLLPKKGESIPHYQTLLPAYLFLMPDIALILMWFSRSNKAGCATPTESP